MPAAAPAAPRRLPLELAVPAVVLLAVAVVLAPVPAPVLDLLLAGNLAVSVLALLGALAARTPLEMSLFPTFLLGSTLVRLVLNVASTRLVLSRAAIDGPDAAGEVVQAFARFVASGDLVVGAVIFAIIAVIQFVVITAGSTRTSEVAARFALDGMPGKQMAIDAEVQAGAMSREEARAARREVQAQADFFAAMDGASRFVRGEAVAGVVITAVNLVGGLAIGVGRHGMAPARAVDLYSRLTIGDGLVSAVPALLVSVATGVLISRSTQAVDLPRELGRQFFSRAHVLGITAVFLAMLALTGLPRVPLLGLAAAMALGAAWLGRARDAATEASPTADAEPEAWTLPPDEPLVVLLGRGLIPLVVGRDKPLVAAVRRVRADIGGDLGIVVPQVSFRDDLALPARGYRILVGGEGAVEGTIPEGKRLALPRTGEPLSLDGADAVEPGGPRRGVWVGEAQAETARSRGAEVLDAAACLARALEGAIRSHADRLLTRDAVARLLEDLRATQPAVVDSSRGELPSLATVHRTLQRLVRDGVPIRPLAEVLEVIADRADSGDSPDALARLVRLDRAAAIRRRLRDPDGRLVVVRLTHSAVDDLVAARSSAPATGRGPARIATLVRRALGPRVERGAAAVVVAPGAFRDTVRDRLVRTFPQIRVLSDEEVADEEALVVFATIGEEEAARAA